jgi:hypothetical protein
MNLAWLIDSHPKMEKRPLISTPDNLDETLNSLAKARIGRSLTMHRSSEINLALCQTLLAGFSLGFRAIKCFMLYLTVKMWGGVRKYRYVR